MWGVARVTWPVVGAIRSFAGWTNRYSKVSNIASGRSTVSMSKLSQGLGIATAATSAFQQEKSSESSRIMSHAR
jgi:hypothetical protein